MEDNVLASDAERIRTVEQLSSAHVQGRLTQDELRSRTVEALEARTQGQLQELTSDLPFDADGEPLLAAEESISAARSNTHYEPPREKNPTAIVEALHPRGMRASWVIWAVTNGALFLLWLVIAISGAQITTPWFLWVAGPWGFVLVIHTIHSRGSRHNRGALAQSGTVCHVPPSGSPVDPRRYQRF